MHIDHLSIDSRNAFARHYRHHPFCSLVSFAAPSPLESQIPNASSSKQIPKATMQRQYSQN